jgi:hypothetical protein
MLVLSKIIHQKSDKMKKYIFGLAVMLVTTSFLFSSCKKDLNLISDTVSTDGSSFLRIINASPNFRNIFGVQDTFNVFLNNTKITATTPGTAPIMTFGSLFPSVSSGYGYVAVPAGMQQLRLTVPGVINPDSIPIIGFSKVFLPNTYYTFMITDSLKSTRDSSQIFVTDTYSQPAAGYFNLRFIHAVLNDTLGKAVDIFSYARNATIFTNLKPEAITNFNSLGVNLQVSDTLYVTRSAASSVPLTSRIVLAKIAFLPTPQRTYTLYYKGDANLATGTKARSLATFVHQ